MKRQIACVGVLFVLGVNGVVTAGQATGGASAAPQEHGAHAPEGPPLTLKAAIDEALSRNLDVASRFQFPMAKWA